MRSAWIRKNSADPPPVRRGFAYRFIYIAYNAAYWILMILPFTRAIEYHTGFVVFFIYIIIRAVTNLYRVNILKPEQAMYFTFRAP